MYLKRAESPFSELLPCAAGDRAAGNVGIAPLAISKRAVSAGPKPGLIFARRPQPDISPDPLFRHATGPMKVEVWIEMGPVERRRPCVSSPQLHSSIPLIADTNNRIREVPALAPPLLLQSVKLVVCRFGGRSARAGAGNQWVRCLNAIRVPAGDQVPVTMTSLTTPSATSAPVIISIPN